MAIVMSELTRTLSESLILPFNCTRYAHEMHKMLKTFEKNYGALLSSHGISLNGLNDAIGNYTLAAELFHKRLVNIDRTQ